MRCDRSVALRWHREVTGRTCAPVSASSLVSGEGSEFQCGGPVAGGGCTARLAEQRRAGPALQNTAGAVQVGCLAADQESLGCGDQRLDALQCRQQLWLLHE